jgi:hypothetical protein
MTETMLDREVFLQLAKEFIIFNGLWAHDDVKFDDLQAKLVVVFESLYNQGRDDLWTQLVGIAVKEREDARTKKDTGV